jgi:hypothetical protein
MATKKFVQFKNDGLRILCRLHENLTAQNVLGQMIQNAGCPFSIRGHAFDTVSWRGLKRDVDKEASKRKENAPTWAKFFSRLADEPENHDYSVLFIGYALSQFVSKLARRDCFTAFMAEGAFADDKGNFSAEAFDKWAASNGFAVAFKDGETVSHITPTGKLISLLIEASKELDAIAQYHSLDSVKHREAGGFQIDGLSLFGESVPESAA